jgi:hypothetical protein
MISGILKLGVLPWIHLSRDHIGMWRLGNISAWLMFSEYCYSRFIRISHEGSVYFAGAVII